MSALSEPLGRGLHRLRVCCDPGEILHARVSVLTPVGKFVHDDRCWSSAARLKSNVPRPVDGHFDVHRVGNDVRGFGGCFSKYHKNGAPGFEVEWHGGASVGNLE